MERKGPDSDTWRAYRRAKLILLILFLGWIPVLRIANEIHTRFHLSLVVPIVTAIVWIVAICFEGWRIALWPCPNCGKSFRGLLPFLPKKCRNCRYPR
jgi:hypothetical protein